LSQADLLLLILQTDNRTLPVPENPGATCKVRTGLFVASVPCVTSGGWASCSILVELSSVRWIHEELLRLGFELAESTVAKHTQPFMTFCRKPFCNSRSR
jgi:hypothetical protein